MYNVPPSIVTSGATFSQLQSNGLSGLLELLITANSTGTPAPTAAATATATGGGSAGGNLAAGTYYFVFTETNGIGETTAAPESAQLTAAAGNIPQVTFPALKSGNSARNLYLTQANGSTGTEVLYAAGITTTTYNLSAAHPAATSNTGADVLAPPTANTTGLQQNQINRIRSAKVTGQLEYQYMHASRAVTKFLEGDPTAMSDTLLQLCNASVVFHALAQAIDDCAALVYANPGHFNAVQNAIKDYVQQRTQP
jgi:hypothetical protein